MPGWELIDLYELNQPGIPIHHELLLRAELRRLAGLHPRLVQLVHPGETMLALALFGSSAMAYWSQGPYFLRNRVIRPLEPAIDEPAQVLAESAALLPLEDVIELSVFVYNYGQLPIWVGGNAEADLPLDFAAPTVPSRRILEGICVLGRRRSCAG